MSEVTRILNQIEAGDEPAIEILMAVVYRELHQMASARLRRENADITLQPTELVNEAYMRLVDEDGRGSWCGRQHFFGAASEAMRRILVDHARSKRSLKRGGGQLLFHLDEAFVADQNKATETLAVHDALNDLEEHDAQAAQLVKLRYFVGMQHQDAAEAMGISKRVADRLWSVAKIWLFRRLH